MLRNKVILLILVTIFALYAKCDDCGKQPKIAMAMMFCEKTSNCLNETENKLVAQLRTCITERNPKFKQILDSGNNLEPGKCLEKVGSGICDMIKDLQVNRANYSDCADYFEIYPISCIVSRQLNSEFEMTKIICADPSKIKCESKQTHKSIDVLMDCVKQNIPDISKLISNPLEPTKCKTDVDQLIQKEIEKNKLKDFIACLAMNRNMFDIFKPSSPLCTDMCIGFV